MAILNGKRNIFRKKIVDIGTVLFENVNESIAVKLQKPTLTADTYAKRHFIVSGRFKVSYPGTSYPDDLLVPGDIWPSADNKAVSEFVVTSLEPNSSYHCLVTNDGRKVVHTSVLVSKGQPLALESSELYVSSVPFTIGDNAGDIGTVMFFKEPGKVFVPQEDGQLITASTVPCDDYNTTMEIETLNA